MKNYCVQLGIKSTPCKAGNTHGVFVTIVSFADESVKLTDCRHEYDVGFDDRFFLPTKHRVLK